jgi:hypothetical protein
MADQDDTKIIDFLRGRFDRIDNRLAEHTRLFGDVITRLARVEREVVDLRRDILGLHEDWVGMTRRLDNLDQRFERIERRLELAETP